MAPKVFFVTGTSTGFGAELVKVILAKGDVCVATARNPDKLSFQGTTDKNFLATELDVTSTESIKSAINAATERFGRIDVLVNNAGYGLSGEFESLSDEQLRKQMEVNFFGLINVTRAGLEVMRDFNNPQGGVIQNVTSIGGQVGVASFSIYCASKWAVEGFTEALAQELKPEWGIKLTCVEPGGFRTDWAGRSMEFGTRHPAYDHMNAKETMQKRNGTQAGDPPKAAKGMYELAVMKDPPLRCVLGTDAYKRISGKLEDYKKNVERFKELSNSTNVDGYEG